MVLDRFLKICPVCICPWSTVRKVSLISLHFLLQSRDIQSAPDTAKNCKSEEFKAWKSTCNASYTLNLNTHLPFITYTIYLQIVSLLRCSVKITVIVKTASSKSIPTGILPTAAISMVVVKLIIGPQLYESKASKRHQSPSNGRRGFLDL